MITRKAICDVCHKEEVEVAQNIGWPGWGAVQGVSLNGVDNPTLCSECLNKVMQFVDGLIKT